MSLVGHVNKKFKYGPSRQYIYKVTQNKLHLKWVEATQWIS